MAANAGERYVFNVEWFDTRAEVIRNYQLTYYVSDGTLSMVSFQLCGLIVIDRSQAQTTIPETLNREGRHEGYVIRGFGNNDLLTAAKDHRLRGCSHSEGI